MEKINKDKLSDCHNSPTFLKDNTEICLSCLKSCSIHYSDDIQKYAEAIYKKAEEKSNDIFFTK